MERGQLYIMFSPQSIPQTNPNTNLLMMRIIESAGVKPRAAVGLALVQMKHGQIFSAGHQENRIRSHAEEQRKAAVLWSEV